MWVSRTVSPTTNGPSTTRGRRSSRRSRPRREKRIQGDGDDGEKDDDDRKVTVTAKIGPSQRQWETEIVERVPGRRIAWRAKGGIQAKGAVTFHRLDDRLTYLTVNIEYKPSGFMETVGNFFRMQRRRVRKDLKLFKNYIELRGEATGKGPGRVRGKGLQRRRRRPRSTASRTTTRTTTRSTATRTARPVRHGSRGPNQPRGRGLIWHANGCWDYR